MTDIPSAESLLGQLLFDPSMVTRFPSPVAPKSMYKVLCSCGKTPTVGKGKDNMTRVVCTHRLYSSTDFSGHVWIGRCKNCGRLFYTARREQGLLPKRPLEIKRHKIITRAK